MKAAKVTGWVPFSPSSHQHNHHHLLLLRSVASFAQQHVYVEPFHSFQLRTNQEPRKVDGLLPLLFFFFCFLFALEKQVWRHLMDRNIIFSCCSFSCCPLNSVSSNNTLTHLCILIEWLLMEHKHTNYFLKLHLLVHHVSCDCDSSTGLNKKETE